MTPMPLIVENTRLSQLAAVGLTLLWGAALPTGGHAQDSHAGHDHAGHDHGEHAAVDAGEHAEGGTHGDQAAGDPHGEEAEAGLHLTPEQRKRFGIVVQPAGPGTLASEVSLPGEVVFNQDRVVHLVPRVSGIARDVFKSVGDAVEAGEVLAVIDSRELADAKADYQAAQARAALAEKTFARERTLRERQVSPEQDYLEAEQAWAEARIARRSSEQKLHALGLPETAIQALDAEPDAVITRYEIRSPIAGTITERHVSPGESLAADADIFTVVDLGSVWVNLTVHTKHIGLVQAHQDVTLRMEHSGVQARGTIAMTTPFAEPSTRSATARVVLDNRDGAWVPGTFVTGFIRASHENLPVVVPRHAVQHIEGRDVVFVPHGDAFEMQPVTVGRGDRTHVEILAGLRPGTPVVAEGAFQLKATVITRTLDSHAGHGH